MDEDHVQNVREQIADKNRRGRTLDEAVKELVRFTPPDVLAEARRRYEAAIQQVENLKDPRVIVEKDRVRWYAGPQSNDIFWPPLRSILERKLGDGFAAQDDASTRIVSLLGCPTEERFTTKGLVLGYVQSGKTGNFTAVMAKAADAGYRLFVVLSGLHNTLRKQTQQRIMKDLVNHTEARWHTLTEAEVDFRYKDKQAKDNPNSLLHSAPDKRILCVVKKNATALRALERWIKAADKKLLADCPVLIIDDEADQASLDASAASQNKRTTINRLILSLLGLVPKGAWVGYTATPYANVLVDATQEDLYPKDFIVDLDRSATYFGAERLFGREMLDDLDEFDEVDDGLDLVRSVSSQEAAGVKPAGRNQIEQFEPTADRAPALKEALRWFVLACAARLVRGQADEHMTMLVHTTLYTDAHREVHFVVGQLLAELRQGVADPALLTELRGLWERETYRFPAATLGLATVPWAEVATRLPEVLGSDPHKPDEERIQIKIDNNKSTFRLDYPEDRGTIQIVVGGNTLSRGLTLEGLMVSYYVRATTMYDTLMQMGRWFGYRPGYGDLTRIWMTDELRDYFRHLALVEAEIRRDIRRYEKEEITPREFGPRIRTHSTLTITSPLKMKNAQEVQVSFSGAVKQTIFFDRDVNILRQNLTAARKLVAAANQVRSPEKVWDTHQLFRGVPVQHIREFLEDYSIHELSVDLDKEVLLGFIEEQMRANSLLHWNVAVVSSSRGGTDAMPVLGVEGHLLQRAALEHRLPNLAYLKAILSAPELAIDFGWPTRSANPHGLDRSELGNELMRWRSPVAWQASRNLAHRQPDGPGVGMPLLLLYPIDKDSEARPADKKPGQPARMDLNTKEHLIGVALAFPQLTKTTPQRYLTAKLQDIDADMETPPEEDEE